MIDVAVVVLILMKSTSRAVPQKRCSPTNFSWLGKFEKILSSLELLDVCGTPFLMMSYFLQQLIRIIISKWIQLTCDCQINCYLQNKTDNLVIFNISIFAKGVAGLKKMTTFLEDVNVCTPLFLLSFIIVMLVYGYFTTF